MDNVSADALDPSSPGPARCWCCDRDYAPDQLLALGARPEATVCLDCATHLHRRARQARDHGRPLTPGRALRGVVARVRDFVIAHRLHGWPVLGTFLHWLDRRLP